MAGGRERNWMWPCVVGSMAAVSALILESRMCASELSGRGLSRMGNVK